MKKDQRIVYTTKLGAMKAPDSTRFVGTVEPGQAGVYVGRHPNRELADWHMTRTVTEPPLYVPVSINQFRAVEGE